MFLAVKGCTELEVYVNESITVRAGNVNPELKISTRAIAKSVASILNWQLANHPHMDKQETAIVYLQKTGWTITTFMDEAALINKDALLEQ